MSVPREASSQDRLIDRLAELRTRTERERFLRNCPEAHRRELVIALDLQVTRVVRVDLKKALALSESAVLIAQAISDPMSLALGLRAKANALMLLDRHQEALDLYQRSVALFESLGEREQAARTLSSSIGAWMWLGRYEGAFAAAEKARDIFAERGDTQRLARLLINVATVYHRQDRFQEALRNYERAYRALASPEADESADPERERARIEGLAVTLSNLATCLIIMNDFDRALETYSRARSFCDAHGMPTLVALVDYNIAYLYYLRGQYSTALELYKSMRERFRKLEDHYHEALCLLDESEMYLELNLSGDAEEAAKAAFETFRDLSTGYEAGKARLNQAIACAQLGKARVSLGLFREARRIFNREKSAVQLSVIDLYQALVLLEEGRFFEARRVARRALFFFESFALPRKTILCRLLLARLSLRIGDLTAAEWECRAALQALEVCEAPILEYQAHCLMGQVQESLEKPGAARGAYESAQSRLEMLRSSLQREDLKIAFMKNRFEVYESQVALCLEQDREAPGERVFSYIEQAKSRGLIDLLLQSVDRRPPESHGSEGAARLRSLREELNWYYHRIELEELRQESGARDRIRDMRQQARLGEETLLRAVRELPGSAMGAFGGSAIGSTEPRSLRDVQKQIPPDAILLEYYRVRERMMACVVTRDRIEVVELGPASRTRELVKRLQFQLSKFRLGTEYVRRFHEPLLQASNHHLAELHEELVAPLRKLLDARHLVVVPHDFLHYLPFHALRADGRYLIDDFTVSYAPSASIFAHCQTLPSSPSGRTLILGFPDERTPHIVDEIRAVAEASAEPTVLLGSSASRKALLELGPGCAAVHIATHGYFRRDNPMFSAVRLGDSYLSLYDLYQLKLPVGFVTLSACATGSSVVVEGDELLGLVRGLLCAGAHSLLVTLWDVQDRATAEFMKSFYSRLRETRDPSLSLRDATLSLRERHPHPYYWAPFVWTGKVTV